MSMMAVALPIALIERIDDHLDSLEGGARPGRAQYLAALVRADLGRPTDELSAVRIYGDGGRVSDHDRVVCARALVDALIDRNHALEKMALAGLNGDAAAARATVELYLNFGDESEQSKGGFYGDI